MFDLRHSCLDLPGLDTVRLLLNGGSFLLTCRGQLYYQVFFSEAATSVIHSLSQEIWNFSMYMLVCEVALEQDLSIGAIFRRKNYLDVPVILSTGPNGM
jgi:hypothetical protein